MKRYMVFSFPEFYPSGGLGDVQGSYETLDEAKKAIQDSVIFISLDGAYIFDRIDGKIVYNTEE